MKGEVIAICLVGSGLLLSGIYNFLFSYYQALNKELLLSTELHRSDITIILLGWPIAIPMIGIVLGIRRGIEVFFVRFPSWLAERGIAKRAAREYAKRMREAEIAAKARPPAEGPFRTPPERCGECGRVK